MRFPDHDRLTAPHSPVPAPLPGADGGQAKAPLSAGFSARLERARRLMDFIPDVREERVADLKDAVESGDYNVPPQEIARKMVNESLIDSALREGEELK